MPAPPDVQPPAQGAPQGRQATFIEETYMVLSEAVGKLITTTPEVIGVAVAIVYAPSLENTDPHGFILGNFNAPGSLGAAGVQVAKLQSTIVNKLQQEAAAAQNTLAELNMEIDAARKETTGETAGDTPGAD